ncbi:glycoside hydrolase [Penicillium rubens]|nr:glycoside hydrolase [Penicillium rubens]
MGIGHKKPNSTGVLGYPIAGEGASYSGLCNFDCNLGLCPPSACGTVEVPLSTPSVSPFLPPACTSGTGVGNLGGLCDFACTHGFCPINACTCTGQGAVNVMSPTTDVTGEAAPGQDSAVYGPLCEYTCQRGYCPEGACVAQPGSSTGSGSGSGSDSDSDDLHVAASVADSRSGSNIVTGVGPLNIIVAPSTLTSTTTFSIESLVTPIEVAWTTTKTVTISGQPTVTTTVTRTVQTTTFAIPEIRTTQIPWWNWNITATNVKDTSTTLFPSFALDPIVFADKPDVLDMTYTATASRTLYPPPWPWSTSSLPVAVPTPTIKFTQGGPSGPTCTSGCGTKCTSFCHTPCLLNCDDPKAHESWKDPADPDPPASHSKCTGPECQNGECTGSNCQKKGCTGSGCDNGVCLDDSCKYSGCIGGDCGLDGSCDGPDCKTVGCEGADCNKSGGCFGFDCISIGCIGIDCTSSTGECTGPKCHMVSCTGPNCQDGVCTGPGCESEDDDCEAREADVCTETVYSTIVTPASTYTTETSTRCETITACSAEASTTTTTIEEDSITAWVGYYNPDDTLDTSAASSLSSSIEAMFSSIYATTTTTSTTSKPSTTSTKPTSVPIGGDCGLSIAQCKGDCPKGKILQCADYGGGPSCTCITDQNVPPYGTMCQSLKDCTDSYYCALGDSMVCEERDYSNGEPVCLCIKGSGS